MLGRYRKTEKEWEEELVSILKPSPVSYASEAPEELIGIVQGQDLNRVLPAELALLDDPETEILFYKKLIEGQLQTFHLQGTDNLFDDQLAEQKQMNQKAVDKGPIILCIDTSSSMQGTPEQIAKVIALAMLKQALLDKRRCYLISFSTNIQTFELTDIVNSLDKLVQFLSMSFHGGTDALPALEHATDMLNEDHYKNADVLMVSDFIMPSLGESLMKNINKARENGNLFNSLTIADSANKKVIECFEGQWVYQPDDPQSLINCVKAIKKALEAKSESNC